MLDLNRHIQRLLSEHDCVIVPEFGAFIADYKPAVVREGKSTIPGKEILFNRKLTRNDGLLINSLIENEGLDYKTAKANIKQGVETWFQQLNNKAAIEIEGVGQLQMDEAGFIQFLAQEDNTCLLDSYGLEAIRLKKITATKESVLDLSPQHLHKRRNLIIKVASAAAVIALLLIISTPLSDEPLTDYAGFSTELENALRDSNTLPQDSTSKDSIPQTLKTPSITAVDSAHTRSSNTKPSPQKEDSINHKTYHIIIASLPNAQMAEAYLNRFKEEYHFETVELLTGQGRYRISVAHFDQPKEAIAFVNSLRLLNPKFSDAWVLPYTTPSIKHD